MLPKFGRFLLGHRVNQRIPLLQAVDPKHHWHYRPPTFAAHLWITRFNQRQQRRLGHHSLHFGKELLSPRRLLLGGVGKRGKSHLLRHWQLLDRSIKVYQFKPQCRGFSQVL